MSAERIYSLDLLRIISMIMIVTTHVLFLSGTLNNITVFSIEYFVTQTLSACAYCFTNCFAMISGYFLCDKKFSFVRILRIYIAVFFYSIFFSFILFFAGKFSISVNNFTKIIFPISSIHYWYITAYIGLCLIYPFINILLEHLRCNAHFFLIGVFSILFILIPGELIGFSDAYGVHNGYSWLWFVYLYVIAAFIKKYPQKFQHKRWFLIFLFSVFLTAGSRFLVAVITNEFMGRIIGSGFLYRYNSFSVALGTISIFLAFSKIKINSIHWKKLIKMVTPVLLGIYLVHMHIGIKEQIRSFLGSIFVYHGYMLYIQIFASVIVIFFVCACIEKLRLILFDKLKLNGAIERVGLLLDKKLLENNLNQ